MAEKQLKFKHWIFRAFIQSVLFSSIMLGFGYWLDARLEKQKHDLAGDMETTKALIKSLEPQTQQRRNAYFELQNAAQHVKTILETTYWEPTTGYSTKEWNLKFSELKNKLDTSGLSGGSGGTWYSNSDIIDSLAELVSKRRACENICSEVIKETTDQFLTIIMEDVLTIETALKQQIEPQTLRSSNMRFQVSYNNLARNIERALGYHLIPVK